jgi:hypothetical protein
MLRLLGVPAALAAVSALSVPTASAAVPAGPRVSLSEAVQTLPPAAELPPGNITGFSETTVAKPTGLNPCNLAKANPLSLHDNGAAIGIYSSAAGEPVSGLAQWVVSTRVFSSVRTAHGAVTRLGAAVTGCPRTAKVGKMIFSRTWSSRYVTAGGWHGYHTVDVITVKGQRTKLRHIAVYLQRGNALIQVDEIAAVVGHNGPTQETRRLAVQKALAARVTAAAQS